MSSKGKENIFKNRSFSVKSFTLQYPTKAVPYKRCTLQKMYPTEIVLSLLKIVIFSDPLLEMFIKEKVLKL